MPRVKKTMPLYSGRLQASYRVPAAARMPDSMGLITFIGGNLDGAFVVKANDDAMTHAGIHIGDALLVKPNQKPVNGSVVAARVNGKPTIRYFTRRADKFSLRAADRAHADIPITPKSNIIIEGIVDMSFRLHR